MTVAEADPQAIADEVLAALAENRLELPTLPDMALKIRELIDDPNVSADDLVHLLSADPLIAGEIIKSANSAAYVAGARVSNLRSAISRLGYRMLRSMVMSIAMTRLFEAGNPRIDRLMKKLWARSREVAANSYVLAREQQHLDPEQALLAGLVHGIGALPLYILVGRDYPDLAEAAVESLVRKSVAPVGTGLLQSWNFPAELIEVPSGHENLQRENGTGVADYVDVVTVANLQMPVTGRFVAWENVHAAARLGLSPAQCREFFATRTVQLASVKRMLGVDAPPPAKPSAPAAAAAPEPASHAQASEPTLLSSVIDWIRGRNLK